MACVTGNFWDQLGITNLVHVYLLLTLIITAWAWLLACHRHTIVPSHLHPRLSHPKIQTVFPLMVSNSVQGTVPPSTNINMIFYFQLSWIVQNKYYTQRLNSPASIIDRSRRQLFLPLLDVDWLQYFVFYPNHSDTWCYVPCGGYSLTQCVVRRTVTNGWNQ